MIYKWADWLKREGQLRQQREESRKAHNGVAKDEKRCTACGEVKSLYAFKENLRRTRRIEKGRNNECIACRSDRGKAMWASGCMDGAFKSPSKPELLMAEALVEMGIKFKAQYRLEGDSHPFDFFIPDRTLIEVDGVYWHSLPGAAERDAEKTRLACEHNYQLLRVTDLDVVDRGAAVVIKEFGLSPVT